MNRGGVCILLMGRSLMCEHQVICEWSVSTCVLKKGASGRDRQVFVYYQCV